MAILNSSNIVNNNVIQTNDLTQLYDALNYNASLNQYLVSISGSLLGTASYATTASFALNGGGGGGAVTQIIAGSNITLSPVGGTGNVTITSTAGSSTSTFPYVGDAIITGSLTITGSNLGPDLIIIGSVNATEGFTGSLSGSGVNTTASYVTLAQTASYVENAQTASFVLTAQTASLAITSQTASKVNITIDTSDNTYFPLIFANLNAATIQQLNIDTDSEGQLYNPFLKSISASSFTGSLSGTAIYTMNAQYSQTSSRSTYLNTLSASVANTSNNFHFLTFVDSDNPVFNFANDETVFTATNLKIKHSDGSLSATTLSSSAVTASSITSSFTGSLFGTATTASYVLTAQTASFATKADTINTVGTTTNNVHFLTFVDTNNITSTGESVYTNLSLAYNPLSNQFISLYITSSFTGSLLGTSFQATSASYAHTASVPLTTTQWTSSGVNPTPLYVPAGRNVGVIWNNAEDIALQSIFLNTSSAIVGDQVQIFATEVEKSQVKIICSGSATPNTHVIVSGLTPNPSTHKKIEQGLAGSNNDNFYFHLICVSGSEGTTNNTTWQLVEYTAHSTILNGNLSWSNSLITS